MVQDPLIDHDDAKARLAELQRKGRILEEKFEKDQDTRQAGTDLDAMS